MGRTEVGAQGGGTMYKLAGLKLSGILSPTAATTAKHQRHPTEMPPFCGRANPPAAKAAAPQHI